jgi:sugar lactone lactonase YvrE
MGRLAMCIRRCLRFLVPMWTAVLLVACGGGGGGAAAPSPPSAPSISAQPQSLTVTEGQPASFSVTASGVAPLSYQWQRNSINIPAANGSTYNIAAPAYADSGTQYRVVVTNAGGVGTTTSAAATLTVSAMPPAIVTQPVSQSVAAGATAIFSVAATGTQPLTYQWSKQVAGSASAAPIIGATFASYSNTNALLADNGAQFTVVVTNAARQSVTSSPANLTVQAVAPFIVTQPQAQSVLAPAAATFVVVAGGTSPLSFQWYKNGTAIPGATNPSYATPATSAADSGSLFHVVVSNGASPITSVDAVLTILAAPVAPSITTQPQPVSVALGGVATFTVAAGGSAPLSYQWHRNGVDIPNATNSSYTLSPVTRADDQASFSVTVNNVTSVPVTSTGAVLTVVLPPTGVDLIAGQLGGPGNIDGTGGGARLFGPQAIATDVAGNVYVADTYNNTIRKVSPTGGVSTLAGNSGNPGSADGTGATALFNYPQGLTVDAAGNVYVVDTLNRTIRTISVAGAVTTLAGMVGVAGSADGIGAAARFSSSQGIAADLAGNLYVADTGNNTIRKINVSSAAVTTLAGAAIAGSADGTGPGAQFNSPQGVAVDTLGNVYVADTNNSTIRVVTPAGVVTTLAGTPGVTGQTDSAGGAPLFDHPTNLATDAAGNVYVSDTYGATIRKIAPGGVVTTLAGAAYKQGSADGVGAAARFFNPWGITADAAGNLYVADLGNDTVRKITPVAAVATLAGSAPAIGAVDAAGSAARFNGPQGVATDAAGNIYVADTTNDTVRKIDPSGTVTTLAGTAGVAGSSDGVAAAAQFNGPRGVATDASGNIYVADTGNAIVRKIGSSGTVSTLAGTAGMIGSTDGAGSVARFDAPQAVAIDGVGNVYVADTGNSVIRKITPAGVVTTLAGTAGAVGMSDGTGGAAQFDHPRGIAVDASGNVYVADTGNWAIRKVDPTGVVTTFAGVTGQAGHADGTGDTARFGLPVAIAADSSGNLYVADSLFSTIRMITPAAVVTTVAGYHGAAGVTLGALPASLNTPAAIAVLPGAAVKLAVSDTAENSILRIALP